MVEWALITEPRQAAQDGLGLKWKYDAAADMISTKVTLRRASPDDLPVLCRWDEQPHVVESDPNDDWHWQEELRRDPEWREQLIAEANGRPVGFLQIIDPAREDSHYWGAVAPGLRAVDIWIGESADLDKGYGTQMMELALARCFADADVTAVLLDPLRDNHRAIQFYERLGFELLEHRRFGADECAVHILTRARWMARSRGVH